MNFTELNVKPELVQALKELGITEPTTIQSKAIPLVQAGRDMVGISNTGSGKTIAFGIPLLEKIVPGQGPQALVMSPTRELAVQIAQELQKFSKYKRCHIAVIYGGVSLMPQIEALSRADVIVGTPGRLLDHLHRNNLNLSQTKIAVLDEADKMVEMGFIEDVQEILDHTPKGRQMLLFGATISEEVFAIKERFMSHPALAKADAQVKADLLKQYFYNVNYNEKFSLLVHLLKQEKMEKAIIFCSSRSTVELVHRNLRLQNLKSEMIHGNLSQNHRLHVIEEMNKNKVDILVASPVAARGLDIKFVTHIFNYDLSPDAEEYIHRVGRTARAGEAGKAITLLSQKDYQVFNAILSRFKVPIEELPLGDFPKLRFEARQQNSFSGRPQQRGSFPQRSGFRPRFGSGGSRPAARAY